MADKNIHPREEPIHALADRLRGQLRQRLIDALKQGKGFPAWAESDGQWQRSRDGNWLGGYAVAAAWDRAIEQPDERHLPVTLLSTLSPLLSRPTAFNGFVFYYAAVHGATSTGDSAATEAALAAAVRLSALMHPTTGVIPLGEPTLDTSPAEDAITFVDPLGPLTALLAFAGRHTHDQALVGLAGTSAVWHLETLVRVDGTVAQAARYHRASGEVREVFTGDQGYSKDSTWSRSPAWALLGAALAAERLPHLSKRLLELITPVATWWMESLPGGAAAPWDFDALEPDVIDTSANAIATVGLLRLARLDTCHRETGDRWRDFAHVSFRGLCDSVVSRAQGAGLTHCCYHRQRGFGVDSETVWGDWYLYEAATLIASSTQRTRHPLEQ